MGSVLRAWQYIFKALPSLFDWVVVLYLSIMSSIYYLLPILHIKGLGMFAAHGQVIIFGSIAIIIASLFTKQQAKWSSVPLGMFALWALITLFRLSFNYSGSFKAFINWCILNEGFIFVIFGVLTIRTIVCYAKNYRLYYIPLAIALVSYILQYRIDSTGYFSLTNFAAIAISLLIVLIVKRRWGWVTLIATYGAGLAIFKWHTFMYKIADRPPIWGAMIRKVTILGTGWNHSPSRDIGWLWPDIRDHGWAFVNNDLIELGIYLGIVGMILAVWFFWSVLKKPVFGVGLFFVMTFLISGLFQRTLFFNMPAGIFLVSVATFIREQYALDKAV